MDSNINFLCSKISTTILYTERGKRSWNIADSLIFLSSDEFLGWLPRHLRPGHKHTTDTKCTTVNVQN
uniref:Uncharacterized protein n=1 Tax=Anguilla anguilla TaxID=7936 RepID=A0A0E9UEN1_ANGAN